MRGVMRGPHDGGPALRGGNETGVSDRGAP